MTFTFYFLLIIFGIMAIDSLYLYLTTMLFTIIIFILIILTIYILFKYGILTKYGFTINFINILWNILWGTLILSVILYILRKKQIIDF